jgi:hypothetical protein
MQGAAAIDQASIKHKHCTDCHQSPTCRFSSWCGSLKPFVSLDKCSGEHDPPSIEENRMIQCLETWCLKRELSYKLELWIAPAKNSCSADYISIVHWSIFSEFISLIYSQDGNRKAGLALLETHFKMPPVSKTLFSRTCLAYNQMRATLYWFQNQMLIKSA